MLVSDPQNNDDMQQCVSEHMEWLAQMTDRVETLQMNTTVFVQVCQIESPQERTWLNTVVTTECPHCEL